MTNSFSYLERVCGSVSSSNLERQVRGSGISISLRIFQFVVIHTINITMEYFPNISLTYSEQELNRPPCSFPMLEESQFWCWHLILFLCLEDLPPHLFTSKFYHSLRPSISQVSSTRLSDFSLSCYRQFPGLP